MHLSGGLGPCRSVSWGPFTSRLQEPVLFGTTIMENIRFGKLDASDDEVYAAARAANAHEFITSFPEGYSTIVGESGEASCSVCRPSGEDRNTVMGSGKTRPQPWPWGRPGLCGSGTSRLQSQERAGDTSEPCHGDSRAHQVSSQNLTRSKGVLSPCACLASGPAPFPLLSR